MLNEIPYSVRDLYARGFNKEEIKAVRKFRELADTLWHVNNADLVKTLKARGYQMYVDNQGTNLINRVFCYFNTWRMYKLIEFCSYFNIACSIKFIQLLHEQR